MRSVYQVIHMDEAYTLVNTASTVPSHPGLQFIQPQSLTQHTQHTQLTQSLLDQPQSSSLFAPSRMSQVAGSLEV